MFYYPFNFFRGLISSVHSRISSGLQAKCQFSQLLCQTSRAKQLINENEKLLKCQQSVQQQSVRERHEIYCRESRKKNPFTKLNQTYQGSLWKRVHKHGLESRLGDKSKIELCWRQFIKGRYARSVYDEFMFNPRPYMSKSKLKKSHGVPKKFPQYSKEVEDEYRKKYVKPKKLDHRPPRKSDYFALKK